LPRGCGKESFDAPPALERLSLTLGAEWLMEPCRPPLSRKILPGKPFQATEFARQQNRANLPSI
jgi:hypothetical protein